MSRAPHASQIRFVGLDTRTTAAMTSFEDGLPLLERDPSRTRAPKPDAFEESQCSRRVAICIAASHAALMLTGIVGVLVMAIWG